LSRPAQIALDLGRCLAAVTERGSKRGVMGETTAGVAVGGGCEWSR